MKKSIIIAIGTMLALSGCSTPTTSAATSATSGTTSDTNTVQLDASDIKGCRNLSELLHEWSRADGRELALLKLNFHNEIGQALLLAPNLATYLEAIQADIPEDFSTMNWTNTVKSNLRPLIAVCSANGMPMGVSLDILQ